MTVGGRRGGRSGGKRPPLSVPSRPLTADEVQAAVDDLSVSHFVIDIETTTGHAHDSTSCCGSASVLPVDPT